MNTPTIAGPSQRAWFRALDHARLTGVKPTWRVGDFYTVLSPRAGIFYRVCRVHFGRQLTYICDCEAGIRGLVCWHKALVAALPYEIALRRGFRCEPKGCTACGEFKNNIDSCPHCDAALLDDPRAITQPLDPLTESLS